MKQRLRLLIGATVTSVLATPTPRDEVFSVLADPNTAARVLDRLSDDDVQELLATLEAASARRVAPTQVWTTPEVSDSSSSDWPRASWPCGFYGVLKAVAPWAEAGSNAYNTTWDLEVPLDLRAVHLTAPAPVAWSGTRARADLEAELGSVCERATANPFLARGGMTSRSCLASLMGQVDAFVDAVCAAETMDRCVNPTPFERLCKLAGTDKSAHHHGFCAFYDRVFNGVHGPRAASEARSMTRSLLEVGVLRGASLAAWSAKYPCAQVLGLDAFATADTVRPGRFHVAFANQEDPASLLAATEGKAFDLIVSVSTKHEVGTHVSSAWGSGSFTSANSP